MDLSLAASAAQGWERDSSVQVGDSLTLAVDCPRLADTSVYYTQTVQNVTVGAIIRYFPEQGVWPFAGNPRAMWSLAAPSCSTASTATGLRR